MKRILEYKTVTKRKDREEGNLQVNSNYSIPLSIGSDRVTHCTNITCKFNL